MKFEDDSKSIYSFARHKDNDDNQSIFSLAKGFRESEFGFNFLPEQDAF